AVQTITDTEGVAGTTSEVQRIRFVTTSRLIGSLRALRHAVEAVADTPARQQVKALVAAVEAEVVMRSTLGDRLARVIRDALGLPEDSLTISLAFADAQPNEEGLQATALVEIGLGYQFTKKFALDNLTLDGLGTYIVDGT